jgi:hypothetical protein
MCEKCVEIDKKIERFRLITRQILDPAFNEAAERQVAELEAEKAALHAAPK